MLLNPKNVSTLPYYVAIINSIFAKLNFLKETTKPDDTEIKDKLVLNSMTWEAAYKI